MKKLLTFLMFFLLAAVAAQAAVVTFTAGTDKSTTTSITKDGVTLTATTFSNDSYYQAYSGTPLKVVSTIGNITKIEITCTASGTTSNYGPSKFSKPGVGSYSYSGNIGTWTGNASTVSLPTSAQVRMTQVVVTTAGDAPVGYTLTLATNSQGTFSATVDGNNVSSGSKVEAGKTVTLAVTPTTGYQFNAWKVYKTADQYNYVTVSENNTFTMPSEAVTVDAYFIEGTTVTAPTFSLSEGEYVGTQTVSISADEGCTIFYTKDKTDPSKSSTAIEYTTPIEITETTTLKAVAMDEDANFSDVVTATYTIVKPLATMDEIFAAATAAGSTATNTKITFNNWVVSGVKGNNAYVTDGTKGFIVYTSNHGFVVGDILSGTVDCKVQLYNGSAELTTLTSTTEGLIVTKGGTITPQEGSIANLSGVNTGAVYTFSELTYNGTDFSDGENTIKPYNTFITLPTLVNGKKYDVTGVYIQFKETKEIAPRTEDDIVLKETLNKYIVTIETPENGTLVVKEGETIVNSGDEVAEGVKLNITATPTDGYKFRNLQVIDATTHTYTASNTKEWTMGSHEITIKANFDQLATYTIKWYANGEKLTEQSLYEGETADEPDGDDYKSVNNKVFTGWVTTARVSSTEQPTYVTDFTVTRDITYYAVYATQSGEESITRVTDVLNSGTIGVEKTSYNNWSEISGESAAIYAGNSARNGSSYETYAIQLKSKDAVSGIVTTASGGKVKKIEVEWASTTTNGRALQVYAKNTAYESAVDLYSEGDQGSLKGTIEKGNTTSFTFDDNDDYAYFGIRSKDGALYLKSISITWETGGATYSNWTTTPEEVTTHLYVSVTTPSKSAIKLDEVLDVELTMGGNGVYGTTEKVDIKPGDQVSFKLVNKEGEVVTSTQYLVPVSADNRPINDTNDPTKLTTSYSKKCDLSDSESYFTYYNEFTSVNFYAYYVNNEGNPDNRNGWHVGVSTKTDVVTEVNDINVADKGVKAYKVIENGQVVIVRGDQRFNIMGQPIR